MLYNNANDNNQYLTRILYDHLVFTLKNLRELKNLSRIWNIHTALPTSLLALPINHSN